MGKIQTAKMVTTHLQFLGLLSKLEIPFPTHFTDFLNFANLINLNFNFFFDMFEIPRIDTRLMFIFVAIGVPLGLMILTGLVFYSVSTIMQIFSAILGILCVVAFIFQAVAPDWIPDDIESNVDSYEFLVLGIAILGGTILFRIGRFLEYRSGVIGTILMYVINLTSVVGGLTLAGSDIIVCKIGLGFVALILAYAIFHSGHKLKIPAILVVLGGVGYICAKVEWRVETPPQFMIPAYILLFLGVCDNLEVVISASGSSASRVFANIRMKLQRFMDTTLLTLAFFGLQSAFVPVVTFCLDLFLCATYECPVGFKFNPVAPRPPDTFSTSADLFCDPCDFRGGCAYNASDLCPASGSRRLLKYPDVRCGDTGYILFIVAALLVLVVFCIVIMVLYKSVIGLCTDDLAKEVRGPTTQNKDPNAPDDTKGFRIASQVDPTEKYSLQVEWASLLEAVDPKASSLYQAYRFEFRYFLLFESFHKIFLVAASVAMAPYYDEAVIPMLLLHFALFAVNLGLHPLIEDLEHKLSLVLSASSTVSAVYAVCVWREPDTFSTDGFAIALIVLCGLIPLIAAIVLLVVEIKNKFSSKKSGNEELEQLEKQMDEKLEREEDESDDLSDLEEALLGPQTIAVNVDGRHIVLPDDDDDDILLGPSTRPAAPVPHVAGAAVSTANASPGAPAPRPKRPRRPRPKRAPAEPERELTAEEKRALEKAKKRKEMTPEERLCDDLNSRTKQVILRYFMIFSVPLLIIALGLTLFATLTSDSPEFLDASQIYDRSRDTVLNGYYSWDTFTEECCCLVTAHPSAQFNLTERWVCREHQTGPVTAGKTVDRGRRMPDFSVGDGLPIRGVCEKPLAAECAIVLRDGNSTVEMECNQTYVDQNNITDRALLGLW
jgi:hypothetical protein